MDANELLFQLKNELLDQKNSLWNKKNKENFAKCISLVDQIIVELPASLDQANKIVGEKEEILTTAQTAANKILDEAKAKADELVSNSSVVKEAQIQADKTIDSANKRCNQLFDSTKQNIDKMLKSLEDYFAGNLSVVKANREELATGVVIDNKN